MRNSAPHLIIPPAELADQPPTFPTQKSGTRDLNSILYGGETATLEKENGASPIAGEVLAFPSATDSVPSSQIRKLRDEWLLAAGRAQHTSRTIGEKRNISDKLLWFIAARDFRTVGLPELEAFFDHLTSGHNSPKGRFDNAGIDVRAKKPLRPVTVVTYHAYLKGFWTYLERRGYIQANPFKILDKPTSQSDQVQPFTDDQVKAMIRAARASMCPHRNEAIILFLLDTGVRASELCGLSLGDVDFSDEQTLRVRVLGKGNKRRTLRLSPSTSLAMWRYFKSEHGLERFYKNRASGRRRKVEPNTPLFITAHRAREGQPLTRSGLLMLVRDLGGAAGIGAIRCSPHTFRHTFAIKFLRNGGDVFSLRDMLGHTNLTIVQRYLSIAQSDIESQHQRFSPVESMLFSR
jgi:site-specific recombinase XerD